VLANGSRLSLTTAQADGRTLVGKASYGQTVRIRVDQIVSLDVFGGCAVYLSELQPVQYEHTPYLGTAWSYTRDATVDGHAIRLQGNTYDNGIGMHSESRLNFDLNGAYDWFETLVGLDERSGKKGSVAIEISVDGKVQNTGKLELTALDGARRIQVRVTGARVLTLGAKFGRGGDVQDDVDWALARLLKAR
jgi:NPCBM/NEW2 domain